MQFLLQQFNQEASPMSGSSELDKCLRNSGSWRSDKASTASPTIAPRSIDTNPRSNPVRLTLSNVGGRLLTIPASQSAAACALESP